ncbi:MAG: site-specific DNA-methyltransferase [Synergistaceae bacterium]|nr:site-specific DNA-methyltransferase [Synergistaceae bacterium]
MTYGEIVNLGVHRLMCGDATKREDVLKLIGDDKVDLVLTDPPYGMKIQKKDGKIGGSEGKSRWYLSKKNNSNIKAVKYPLLIGDKNQDTARLNYDIIKDICKLQIIWGGQYFAHFLPVNGGWIFWDKLTGTTNFSDGELAWRSWGQKIVKYEQKWNGVIRAGRPELNLHSRVHPTQKPVELHMKILQDFSKEGDVVLDCFGGSGTTLIACNETGRKCLMMELSPEYCDIIADRYEKISQQLKIY